MCSFLMLCIYHLLVTFCALPQYWHIMMNLFLVPLGSMFDMIIWSDFQFG
uniref:Uncharacterized protein n=1 Tax=Arundo donax TaxID=35708 RepID=A0A0A9H298_ARUDO